MNKLNLTLACWDYDRTKALMDGTVQVNGINLIALNQEVEETFWRMLQYQEFDVSEMSLSSYLMNLSRGNTDLVAIPVFPSRFFRHSCIFINKNSGIQQASDLKGKRIGVPEYQMTAALWIRGILHHEYGVAPSDVKWLNGGLEQTGRAEKLKLELPDNISIQPIKSDQTLNQMLEEGELDAIVSARAPSSFLNGSSNVGRLFPNYKEVEKDYYSRTGIFPIMHLVVIKKKILDEYPWVARNLYDAFLEAKRKCLEGLKQTAALRASVPWLVSEVEETIELMGGDFWPYGIENNRATLEAALQYSYEQGLSKKLLTISDIFASTTQDGGFKI